MQNKNPLIRNNNSQNSNDFNIQQNQPNTIMDYIQKYSANPQLAQQEVQQLLNSGQINQQMINNLAPQVMQFIQKLGLK